MLKDNTTLEKQKIYKYWKYEPQINHSLDFYCFFKYFMIQKKKLFKLYFSTTDRQSNIWMMTLQMYVNS